MDMAVILFLKIIVIFYKHEENFFLRKRNVQTRRPLVHERELAFTQIDFNVIDILNMDASISYSHRRKIRAKDSNAPNSEPWERSVFGRPRETSADLGKTPYISPNDYYPYTYTRMCAKLNNFL